MSCVFSQPVLSYTLVPLVGVTQAIHTWRVMQLRMTLITNNMNDNSVIRCTQEVGENESVHKARVHAGAYIGA